MHLGNAEVFCFDSTFSKVLSELSAASVGFDFLSDQDPISRNMQMGVVASCQNACEVVKSPILGKFNINIRFGKMSTVQSLAPSCPLYKEGMLMSARPFAYFISVQWRNRNRCEP